MAIEHHTSSLARRHPQHPAVRSISPSPNTFAARFDSGLARSSRGRVEIRHVTKLYPGSDMHALKDITLTAEPGEFVVVVGPSGCGKSTLLNIVAGLLTPNSGEIYLDGRPVGGPGPERAMVFQEPGLFPWLNASQNVEFGLKMTGVPKAARREAVARALEMVHLSHAADMYIHQLSGGMKQRVAIARALVIPGRVTDGRALRGPRCPDAHPASRADAGTVRRDAQDRALRHSLRR